VHKLDNKVFICPWCTVQRWRLCVYNCLSYFWYT